MYLGFRAKTTGLLFAILLAAILTACSQPKKVSEFAVTKDSVSNRTTETVLDSFERLPGGASGTTRETVLAKYFPGANHDDLKTRDFLQASQRAIEQLDYDSAVILCTEAIKLSPEDPAAYFMRGRARLDANSSDSAKTIDDLEKAVALNYDDSKAYELLARVYEIQSQTKKAIDCTNRAIEIYPKESGLYKLKAALHAAHGDQPGARKAYESWIRIMPNHPLPYTLRGQLLESMRDYDAALKDYQKVCTLPEAANSVSNRDMVFRLRAGLLSKLGRHSESISVLSEALKQDDDEDELYRLRGDEYMLTKNYQRAISDYTQSITKAPEFATKALEARSRAYARIGDRTSSAKDFIKAKELRDKPAERPVY